MKSFLLSLLTCFSFCILVACSNNNEETAAPAPQAADQGGQGQQNVDVKSPDSGTGHIPVQNPGAAGAARAISPVIP